MELKPCKPFRLESQSMNAARCRPRRQASFSLSNRRCTWMERSVSPAAAMQRFRVEPCASEPLSCSSPLQQQPQTPGFSPWKTIRRACTYDNDQCKSPAMYSRRVPESKAEVGDVESRGFELSETCDMHQAERSLALLKEAVAITAAKLNETRSAVSSARGLPAAKFNSGNDLATELSRIILLMEELRWCLKVEKAAQEDAERFLTGKICPAIEDQLAGEQDARAAVQDDLDHFTLEVSEFHNYLGRAKDDTIQRMVAARRHVLDEVASLRENLQQILDCTPQWGEKLLNQRSPEEMSSMQWTLAKEECNRCSAHRQLNGALQSIKTLGGNLDSATTQSQMDTLKGIIDKEICMQKVLLRHLLPSASNYSVDIDSGAIPDQARGAAMLSLISQLASAMKENGEILAIWGGLMETMQQEKGHRAPAAHYAESLYTAEMQLDISSSAGQPPLTYTNRQTDLYSLQELGTGLRDSLKDLVSAQDQLDALVVGIQKNDSRIDEIHNELKKTVGDLSTLAEDSQPPGYQESSFQNGTSGTAASICWLEGVIQDVSLLGSLRSDRHRAVEGLISILDAEVQERVSVQNALNAAIRSLSFMGDELQREGTAEPCASLADALVQGADAMISLQGDALLAIDSASASVDRANFSGSSVRDFEAAAEQAMLDIGTSMQDLRDISQRARTISTSLPLRQTHWKQLQQALDEGFSFDQTGPQVATDGRFITLGQLLHSLAWAEKTLEVSRDDLSTLEHGTKFLEDTRGDVQRAVHALILTVDAFGKAVEGNQGIFVSSQKAEFQHESLQSSQRIETSKPELLDRDMEMAQKITDLVEVMEISRCCLMVQNTLRGNVLNNSQDSKVDVADERHRTAAAMAGAPNMSISDDLIRFRQPFGDAVILSVQNLLDFTGLAGMNGSGIYSNVLEQFSGGGGRDIGGHGGSGGGGRNDGAGGGEGDAFGRGMSFIAFAIVLAGLGHFIRLVSRGYRHDSVWLPHRSITSNLLWGIRNGQNLENVGSKIRKTKPPFCRKDGSSDMALAEMTWAGTTLLSRSTSRCTESIHGMPSSTNISFGLETRTAGVVEFTDRANDGSGADVWIVNGLPMSTICNSAKNDVSDSGSDDTFGSGEAIDCGTVVQGQGMECTSSSSAHWELLRNSIRQMLDVLSKEPLAGDHEEQTQTANSEHTCVRGLSQPMQEGAALLSDDEKNTMQLQFQQLLHTVLMLVELRREGASASNLALNTLRAEVNLTRSELAKSTVAFADRQELVEMLTSEISWLDQNMDQLAADLELACEKERQLIENLETASAEIGLAGAALQSWRDQEFQRIVDVEKDLADHEAREVQLEATIARLQANAAKVQSFIEEKDDALGDLGVAVSGCSVVIQSEAATIQAARRDMQQLAERLSELEEKVAATYLQPPLSGEVAKTQEDFVVDQKSASLHEELQSLESDVQELKCELISSSKSKAVAEAGIERIQTALNEKDAALQEEVEKHAAAKREVAQLQEDMEELQSSKVNRIAHLAKDIKDLQGRLHSTQQDLSIKDAVIEQLRAKEKLYLDYSAREDAMMHDLNKSKEAEASARSDAVALGEELRQSNAALKEEMGKRQDAERELSLLRSALDAAKAQSADQTLQLTQKLEEAVADRDAQRGLVATKDIAAEAQEVKLAGLKQDMRGMMDKICAALHSAKLPIPQHFEYPAESAEEMDLLLKQVGRLLESLVANVEWLQGALAAEIAVRANERDELREERDVAVQDTVILEAAVAGAMDATERLQLSFRDLLLTAEVEPDAAMSLPMATPGCDSIVAVSLEDQINTISTDMDKIKVYLCNKHQHQSDDKEW